MFRGEFQLVDDDSSCSADLLHLVAKQLIGQYLFR